MEDSQRPSGSFQRAVRRSDEVAREPLYPRCPIGWENFVPSGRLRAPFRFDSHKQRLTEASSASKRLVSTAAPFGLSVQEARAPEALRSDSQESLEAPFLLTVLASRPTGDKLPTPTLDLDEASAVDRAHSNRKPKLNKIYLVEWSRVLAAEEAGHWGLVDISSASAASQTAAPSPLKRKREDQTALPFIASYSERMKLTWVTVAVLERFGKEAFAYYRKQQEALGISDSLSTTNATWHRPKRNARYARRE